MDAFYGCGEAACCIEDAICDRDFGDEKGVIFISEHVDDTFAAGVMLDDFDASIMLEGWADVPHIQFVKTP